jgi:phosphoglycolate phosphatase
MLYACKQAGSEPGQCVYIGDAERDIKAGNNAGMQTLVALFGYIQAEDDPHRWNANATINTPGELLDWLNSR